MYHRYFFYSIALFLVLLVPFNVAFESDMDEYVDLDLHPDMDTLPASPNHYNSTDELLGFNASLADDTATEHRSREGKVLYWWQRAVAIQIYTGHFCAQGATKLFTWEHMCCDLVCYNPGVPFKSVQLRRKWSKHGTPRVRVYRTADCTGTHDREMHIRTGKHVDCRSFFSRGNYRTWEVADGSDASEKVPWRSFRIFHHCEYPCEDGVKPWRWGHDPWLDVHRAINTTKSKPGQFGGF